MSILNISILNTDMSIPIPVQRAYYKQNRLKQLRAFCYAAQSRSMSRAAGQMYLSQPSISLLVQSLEANLGCRLFLRHGPRIALTDEGRALLDLALPLVEGLESLPEAFHERCNNLVTGSLNIAAGESTTLYLLPGIVNRFAELYPHIPVTLHNASGNDGLALLRSGSVDFAVGPVLQVPEDILFTPLFSYEPVLIMPPGHPLAGRKQVTLRDIQPYPLIMPPRQMSTRAIIDVVFQQHGIEHNVKMEAGGWEVIKRYVAMGLGISIVTSICLTGGEKLARISLRDYFPGRSYGLILRRGKVSSPAARRFIELMRPGAVTDPAAAPAPQQRAPRRRREVAAARRGSR
jgi:DNA-binding transcriptional LysR family regulator